MLGSGCIFVALFITNFLDYINKIQQNNYIEWDLKTLTSGDYTVSVEIGDDFYAQYLKDVEIEWLDKCAKEGRERFLSGVQGFQEWFRHEIETRLKRLLNLGYDEDSEQIKVAFVTLAFNNSDIIELLVKRGTAIVNEKWDEVEKLERKCIKVKNKHLDRLRAPCHVFLTFQNEEGCERMK